MTSSHYEYGQGLGFPWWIAGAGVLIARALGTCDARDVMAAWRQVRVEIDNSARRVQSLPAQSEIRQDVESIQRKADAYEKTKGFVFVEKVEQDCPKWYTPISCDMAVNCNVAKQAKNYYDSLKQQSEKHRVQAGSPLLVVEQPDDEAWDAKITSALTPSFSGIASILLIAGGIYVAATVLPSWLKKRRGR